MEDVCILCQVSPRDPGSFGALFCRQCQRSCDARVDAGDNVALVTWAVTRALKLRKGTVSISCTQCGKRVRRNRGTVRFQKLKFPDWKMFCSRKCAGVYRRSERTSKVCPSCNREFVKERSDTHRKAVYCSIECQRLENRFPDLPDKVKKLRARGKPLREIAAMFSVSHSGLKAMVKRIGAAGA